MSKTSNAICAALAGLKSSITRAEIVERCGLTSVEVGGSLHRLVKSGRVIKHPGATLRTAGYTLDPETAERMEPKRAAPVEKKRRYSKRNINVEVRPIVHAGGNALMQAHVATTLGLLTAIMDIDVGNLRALALACHREAVEIMQASKP